MIIFLLLNYSARYHSVCLHTIFWVLLTFQKKKKKKKDTIPTKPLTWQMRMKVPLIFMFDCRNMADICARFKENPSRHFSDVTSRKTAQTNGYTSSLESCCLLEEDNSCTETQMFSSSLLQSEGKGRSGYKACRTSGSPGLRNQQVPQGTGQNVAYLKTLTCRFVCVCVCV